MQLAAHTTPQALAKGTVENVQVRLSGSCLLAVCSLFSFRLIQHQNLLPDTIVTQVQLFQLSACEVSLHHQQRQLSHLCKSKTTWSVDPTTPLFKCPVCYIATACLCACSVANISQENGVWFVVCRPSCNSFYLFIYLFIYILRSGVGSQL